MTTETLLIQIDSKGARVVQRDLENIGKSSKRAAGATQLLGRAIGAIGFGALATQLVRTGDEFRNIQNRLKLVTTGTENLNSVTDQLLDISQRTRSDLGANAELFNRVSLATRDLGTSQEEVLNFTESLNQAIKISGASAQEAQAGLIQLSQGLASGALRGDELRSVLEQLPAVADVIADELNVTRGELRLLGQEGKLTADVILRGFRNARGELAERFQQTVGTVADEFTKLRNQLTVTIGRFFEITGATDGLAGAINSVTEFVRELTPQILGVAKALKGTLTPQDELSAGAKVAATAIIVLTESLRQLASLLSNTIGAAFRAAGNQLGGFAAAVAAALDGEFGRAGEILSESFSDTGKIIVDSSTELRETLIGNTTDTIEKLVQLWDEGARATAELQAQTTGGSEGDTGGGQRREIVDPAARKALEDTIKAQTKFLESLEEERAALELQSQTAIEYSDALQEVQIRQLEAQTGVEGFGDKARASVNAIAALNAELERQKNIQADAEAITALEDELELLGLSNRERAIEVELRKLSADATEEQREATAQLAGEIFDQSERARRQVITLDETLKEAARSSQGLLADALSSGFDELPQKFSQLLLDLSAQLLASEIFRLLGGLGGPGGGGFLGAIGTFFSGGGLPGFNNGANFTVGGSPGVDQNIVAFRATRGEQVSVTPAGQAQGGGGGAAGPITVQAPPVSIVNVASREEALAALGSSAGEEVILNVLAKNREEVRNNIA